MSCTPEYCLFNVRCAVRLLTFTVTFRTLCIYLTFTNKADCHPKPVFLNRRAAARYRALASIIPGREKFSRNLSF